MHPVQTVFGGQYKGLGQIVTGHDQSVLFGLIEKRHRLFGITGVVQIKYPDDRLFPHRHIISDG